jgi:N-acetylneuraminic acid mutarotase
MPDHPLTAFGGGGVIVEAEGPLGDPNGGDDIVGWNNVASLGTGRNKLSAATDDNGLIYAIGGASSSNSQSDVVEQYDPATDTWSQVSSLGIGRRGLGVTKDNNGLIYAIGGESSSNLQSDVVERYDPANDTWTTISSLPTARAFLSAATDGDGDVYAIAGDTGPTSESKIVDKYDVSVGSWSSVAQTNNGNRFHGSTSDSNGNLYMIGGDNQKDSVEKYDPANDTWTLVASLPTGQQNVAAVNTKGFIYAVGGDYPKGADKVDRYDPANDSWISETSLNTGRGDLAASVDNDGFIYAIGGRSSNNTYETLVSRSSFNKIFVDIYSATGDTLFDVDSSNAVIKNKTTSRSVTGESLIARDGETIAAFTTDNARYYRTEET